MIVVDLGCYPHDSDVSIEPLVARFSPDVLYGFDPFLAVGTNYFVAQTRIELRPYAAWTHDGYVGFIGAEMRSRVYETELGTVPCFDLARYIAELPDDEIVLKMDVEGAEYALIQHLCAMNTDERLALLLVEWHCAECGRGGDNVEGCPDCGAPVAKIGGLRCSVEEWDHGKVAA